MKAYEVIEKGEKLGSRIVNGRKRNFYLLGENFASCNDGGTNPQLEDAEQIGSIDLFGEVLTVEAICDTVDEIVGEDGKTYGVIFTEEDVTVYEGTNTATIYAELSVDGVETEEHKMKVWVEDGAIVWDFSY